VCELTSLFSLTCIPPPPPKKKKKAQREGERFCRIGASVKAMQNAVTEVLAVQLEKLQMLGPGANNSDFVHFFCPHSYFHVIIHVCKKNWKVSSSFGKGIGLDTHEPLYEFLLNGTVFTIEPGLYFNRVAFTKQTFEQNPRIIRQNVEPLVENGFGGIRIEDTYLVTEKGCVALSNAAKTIEEIEDLMN
jgi:Xaa-Pro aminopeptidase